jgi:adenylate cyclase
MNPNTGRMPLESITSPSPDKIREYLERLLGTDAFKATPQRRKLLEYVVEQTLAGRANRLKAYELALVVLGRNERFDSQNDPIVRIEMGRLRRDLDNYYLHEGHADPVRISIPKGKYVPAFVAHDPAPDDAPEPAPTAASAVAAWGGWPGRAVLASL